MVIFFESGRLGNQLFQYVALRSLFPKPQKIILIGFDSLKNTFDGIDAIFIKKNNLLISFLVRVVRKLERMGWLDCIFNTGFESDSENKISIKKNIPWLNILYIKESYFQAEYFLDEKIIRCIKFKPTIKNQLPVNYQSTNNESCLIFVHIRRGDYLWWPSENYPAALNDEWYLNQIEYLKEQYSNSKIIIFTDDPCYVNKYIIPRLDSEKELVHISEAADMYLMSICNAGILSPSSYSLWGVILNKNFMNSIFLAPEYWIGHRKNVWYPSINIKLSKITYVSTGVLNA